MKNINAYIREIIDARGIKITKVSSETGINYQRLNRLFNQHASMTASELISMCKFLKIDPNVFLEAA